MIASAHSHIASLSFWTLRVAGKRFYSREIVQKINNKPIWLQDISTYPVIAVCAFACAGAGSYSELVASSCRIIFFSLF